MTYLAEIEKITGIKGVRVEPVVTQLQYCEGGNTVTVPKITSRFRVIGPDDKPIAAFNLSQFNGCCGICLSFHTSIEPKYQGKGLGRLLMKMKEQIACNNGYTFMVATDKCANMKQMKVFDGAKWVKSAEFRNKRTHNTVGLFTRVVQDTMIQLGFPTPGIRAY